jgi:uncharacterized protein DUF4013
MASQPGTAGGGSIDFGRAFAFYFEDPDWLKKTLIGGGLYLAGTIGLVLLLAGLLLYAMVAGYAMRVMQRAYAGDPRPLPEWEDYGGLMRDGFKLVLLSLGYAAIFFALPALVIVVITVIASASHSDALSGLMALVVVLMQLLAMLLGLGYLIYAPSAVARMTLYQRLGAGFEFKENLALIKRNPANYGIALLIIVVTHVVSQVGVILCCVGLFATSFWSFCVSAWVLGEVVRRDPLIGQPLAPAPAPTPGL